MSSDEDGRTCIHSDQEERCKRLLRNFRVAELQTLLRQYGLPRTGRKNELYHRSLDMLHSQDPKQIEERIKLLYAQIQSSRQTAAGFVAYLPQPDNSLADTKDKRFPKGNNGSSGNKEAWRGRTPYHHALHASSVHPAVIHPDVKFKELPFYSIIDSVIKPTALVSHKSYSRSSSNQTQDASLQFHLSPQQIQTIIASKSGKKTYGVQVQLRICRQETSCPQDDVFPKMCYLRVNSEYTPLPGYYPQLSQKAGYKPSGRPIDITHLLKLSASVVNKFTILWQYDVSVPQGHVACCNLVRSHTAADLLNRLQGKGVRTSALSRALLKDKMSSDVDAEIATTSLRVSLVCPLGKMRMKIPCRALSCTHLQCFDASLYLQMNERKTTWICPVCDKPAPFIDLIIDGLFKEILESSLCTDIEFYQDGTWRPITDAETDGGSSGNAVVDKCVYRVDGVSMPVRLQQQQQGAEVIDLTLSDSEDEAEDEGDSNCPSVTGTTSDSTSSLASVDVTGGQDPLIFLQRGSPPIGQHPVLNLPQSYVPGQFPLMLGGQLAGRLDENSPTMFLDFAQHFNQSNRDSPVIVDNRYDINPSTLFH